MLPRPVLRRTFVASAASLLLVGAIAPAQAADTGVLASKLIVVDTAAAKGTAKVVFAAKDAAITKGAATDTATISAILHLAYDGGAADGAFVLPVGDVGWLANKGTFAKFVNSAAPAGSTQAKVSKIVDGKVAMLVGAGLGDTPFEVFAAGDPAGSVYSAYCVTNGGDENCFCSVFSDCAYKTIAGDTGAKLVCKAGASDSSCLARCGGVPCPVYDWVVEPFTACSTTCGDGTQTRVVKCVEQNTVTDVDDALCADAGPRPSDQQACNEGPCPVYDWVVGPFTVCSTTCGDGTQTRTVQCYETLSMTPAADSNCNPGTQPATAQACNLGACPLRYQWNSGAFGACSTTCGTGTQTRTVTCLDTFTSSTVSDSFCSLSGPKPATSQSCNPGACPSYAWQAGAYSTCSVTCGGGTQTRTVQCVEQNSMTTVADPFCAGAGAKPATSQSCNTDPCPSYVWQAGAYSLCSATCGPGVQTRTVQCVHSSTLVVVADPFCTDLAPATLQACNLGTCP